MSGAVGTRDFERILKSNVKAGPYKEPRCVVEVDKYSFVPGKMKKIVLDDWKTVTKVEIERKYFEGVEGLTLSSSTKAVFPVQGASMKQVTSNYGPRGGRLHAGIDIGPDIATYPRNMGMGNPILAAWGGTVSIVSESNKYSGYGVYVEITHSDTLKTRYAHLQKPLVTQGQEVGQGQQIGLMGNTGNVMSQGRAVTGQYGDAGSMRARGYGTHLHFEIRTRDTPNGTFKPVDPAPYLKGTSTAPGPVKQSGATAGPGDTVKGYRGNILHTENFRQRNWMSKGAYKPSKGYRDRTIFDVGGFGARGNSATTVFGEKRREQVTLDIKVNVIREATLDIHFASNMKNGQGDRVTVEAMGSGGTKTIGVFPLKGGKTTTIQRKEGIYVPSGTHTLRIKILHGGVILKGVVSKVFKLGVIRLREIALTREESISSGNINQQASMTELQQGGKWVDMPRWHSKTGRNRYPFEIPTGNFSYSETLTLDNVQNVTISRSMDQDTATLTMTLSNPEGFYSEDYNPYYFPEVFSPSPFAQNHGGIQTGVMSYNTPIRVYMGYGPYMIRVFTGTIDTVDPISGGESVMTVTARDMYKKVTDKVLTESKGYSPKGYETNVKELPEITKSRQDFIEQIGKKAVADYPRTKILPSLAIAQAAQESGWGTSFVGNNIFGIKADDGWKGPSVGSGTQEHDGTKFYHTNGDFRSYGSINEAMENYYQFLQAKRYDKVRAATNYKDAARAVKAAGYATDPGYAQKLIDIIEGNNLMRFDQQVLGKSRSGDVEISTFDHKDNIAEEGTYEELVLPSVPWLKSAVVQDLIQHAGMVGWRENHDDLQYPDAVIEESYIISVNQESGTYVRALSEEELPVKDDTEIIGLSERFEVVKIEPVPTPDGWMQPYVVEEGLTFEQYEHRVGDAIDQVLQDTHYVTYCDRFGTFRMETLEYDKPIVATYTAGEDIEAINKSTDFSRARSHIMVIQSPSMMNSFVDKEMMIEMKGELRTSSVEVPWADTWTAKKQVAERMFQDMKRLARTLTVDVVCNPGLDLMDRIMVIDKETATNAIYTIKGITLGYDGDRLTQTLDLFWAGEGTVI